MGMQNTPPSQVGSGLTLAALRAFAIYGGFVLHMKETAPVEGDQIIGLFKSPITPHHLPTWEGGT